MPVAGRSFFPWLVWQVARDGSRELFTLCALAATLGIAYGSSAPFGVSFTLGAFFAGRCCANRRWVIAPQRNRCR